MNDRYHLVSGVSRHRLSNGLSVLLREDHSVPIVTSMIWYGVGSRHEGPGDRGISHLLEHLMFKGTDRYGKGEIDHITTRNGGSNNAFTSFDYTAYYFSFASDRWLPALQVEASRMKDNRFDSKEFELERNVVMEELRMENDQPWGALHREVELLSFDEHPYRYPVIGLMDDLVGMTLDRVVAHYQTYYAPNNATLVVVGDFDSKAALGQIEDLFGAIPERKIPQLAAIGGDHDKGLRRVEINRTARISRLLFSFPAPSLLDPRHYAIQAVDRLLSEGKLSRLYRRLVEEESLATSLSTEVSETLDPYLFFIRIELRNGVERRSVEDLVFEEMKSLREAPVSPSDLQRAKNQCIADVLGDFETTLDAAAQLGALELLTGYEYWRDYIERIEGLTPEDVLEAAAGLLLPERAVIGQSARTNGI